jgi:hypothetical protein
MQLHTSWDAEWRAARAVFASLCWAVSGAALGLIAGGLTALLVGVLDALLHTEPHRVLSHFAHLAASGGIAGAVSGAFVRMIDPDGVIELTGKLRLWTGASDPALVHRDIPEELQVAPPRPRPWHASPSVN